MDKLTITKQELLERTRGARGSFGALAATDVDCVICATAEALGYAVTDEPELPEKLYISVGVAERAGLAFRDNTLTATPTETRLARALGLELVRRYNAKAVVLEVADQLSNPRGGIINRHYATLLRAAYTGE